MVQLIAVIVSIYGSLTFLADMYSFLDLPCGSVRLPVDYPSLRPFDHMVLMSRIVSKCRHMTTF